jgi:hypothetical protein
MISSQNANMAMAEEAQPSTSRRPEREQHHHGCSLDRGTPGRVAQDADEQQRGDELRRVLW